MQTECISGQLEFEGFYGRRVVAAFDGGALTSDAGALLLRETDRAIRLIERVAACFSDGRDPGQLIHALPTLVGQRIVAIALGYEDVNDHDRLRFDPVLALFGDSLAAKRKDCAPLAGKSTMNRLEHARGGGDRYHKIGCDREALLDVFVDVFLDAHSKAPREIVLDLDATDDPLHGHQEGRFFHGYSDCYCYLTRCASFEDGALPGSSFVGMAWPVVEATMDLERFIVEVFCLTDDFVQAFCCERKLRQRGPAPTLADSEVLTIEIAGEFLGLDTDQGLFTYFRRHFSHFFPGLSSVHRTTFVRQAANLWGVKRALWQHLAASVPCDPTLVLIDSLPVPVCRFARAYRCRGFAGWAAFGYDALAHQTYYGLRLHARVAWPGVITAAGLTPANTADPAVAPELLGDVTGWALGDSAYWSPTLRAELAPGGLALLARPRGATAETTSWPR